MNDHLKQIGWGAVTVNGFIPSQAFMEFQAYRVLIIAADIRQIEHIEYTPHRISYMSLQGMHPL
ncbi:hypothetical protein KRR40_30250 [Niabella defluvii]|nr:hypothetical protein KRR40_30250 [Niabella sp. I65]